MARNRLTVLIPYTMRLRNFIIQCLNRYFATILFDYAGISTQNSRLIFTFLENVSSALGAFTGAMLADRGNHVNLSVLVKLTIVLTSGPAPIVVLGNTRMQCGSCPHDG